MIYDGSMQCREKKDLASKCKGIELFPANYASVVRLRGEHLAASRELSRHLTPPLLDHYRPQITPDAASLRLLLPGRAPRSAIDLLGAIAYGCFVVAVKRPAIPLALYVRTQSRALDVEVVRNFDFAVL